ncbi:MAG: cupin [Limnoraphis robusta]|uniref:Cupin n=2 Tax=Limnoraphis robusta TaxID=1118279 RepID=A0A0F5YM24_9CYAN|nr:cupin [Limnoraphis robusta]KKD39941.1 cupin [Limnoraphis robusta CS-951]MEA5497380.1 cupin [Limnoraphis robusta BA-68 BA1]MEA5518756.1 cupin [Limnoraphis robusta CCNP1315]MEA5539049.1 cupin [Limnoraphis robusta Tam1]MEA5545434.1 cupin [Limnoraphis robusta CCNP1324]
MNNRDWLVREDGQCLPCESARDWDLLKSEYRLHRFLTEIEDGINQSTEKGETEIDFLPDLRRLVRQLITNSYWLRTQVPEPCTKTGTSIIMLYDEIGFPLTVQTETVLPGRGSPIHNHGTWGIVAVLKGQQKNVFWKRQPSTDFPDQIEKVGEKILKEGEIISFTSDAIHHIEAVGDEPSFTFNLYGETNAANRFQFNAESCLAKPF